MTSLESKPWWDASKACLSEHGSPHSSLFHRCPFLHHWLQLPKSFFFRPVSSFVVTCEFRFYHLWTHPLALKMEHEYDWLSRVGVDSLFDQSCDVEGMWKASSCGGFTLHLPLKCKISRPKLCINTLCIVCVISTHVKGPCDNGGRGLSRHQHEDKRLACISPTEGSLITCAKNTCLIIVFLKYIFF